MQAAPVTVIVLCIVDPVQAVTGADVGWSRSRLRQHHHWIFLLGLRCGGEVGLFCLGQLRRILREWQRGQIVTLAIRLTGVALPGSHTNGAQKCRPLQHSQSQWSVCATMRHCRLRRPRAGRSRHQRDRRRHCKRQPDHRPCGRGHATRCQHLHRLHGWNCRHHSWRRNDKSCVQRSNRQNGTAKS